MTTPTQARVSQEALERHMQAAASGDTQIVRHGTLGTFVLCSWEEWAATARAAGRIVPDIRLQAYSDEEWDLDSVLVEDSGVVFCPHPDGEARL